MRKYLANSNVPFAEQVTFEYTNKAGEVIKGRFDLVFRDKHGRLVIPELKGVNVNKLHGNQRLYSDDLDKMGGQIKFTSNRTAGIGLKKGEIVHLTREQYFRMGKMDLADFESALQKVTGGKPIVGRYFNADTGEYHTFTDKAEHHKFLQSRGIKPTRDPKGGPRGGGGAPGAGMSSGVNSLAMEGFKMSMQDMQQELGSVRGAQRHGVRRRCNRDDLAIAGRAHHVVDRIDRQTLAHETIGKNRVGNLGERHHPARQRRLQLEATGHVSSPRRARASRSPTSGRSRDS